VIDAYVRVSLVGIEILTIDARIVIASVDTYLRFAEATNRLDLTQQGGKDLTELMEGMTESGSKGKGGGAVEGVKDALTPDAEEDGDEEKTSETETQKQDTEKSSRQKQTPLRLGNTKKPHQITDMRYRIHRPHYVP